MNAITERWTGGCRRELMDRTLVWNQNRLRRILREYESHHNQHRPHRSLHGTAPRQPCRRTAWDRSPAVATTRRDGQLSSPACYSKEVRYDRQSG
jgi:Integrase core domain